MDKVYVITGPTGAGKTRLAILLAEEMGGEIISADSMQIYTGMDIGTAKATPEERIKIPHHLIDIRSPRENYSVAEFKKDAEAAICDILARGKTPIVCGGTGLYIESLIRGNDFVETDNDPVLRGKLEKEYDEKGGEAMLERLRQIDGELADRLHANDRKRIIRGLEVFMLTGKTATENNRLSRISAPKYEYVLFGILYEDRAELYEKIDKRVDSMLEEGLMEETKSLFEAGLLATPTASQAIAYKELKDFFTGASTYNEAVALLKRRSRNYAKRQITWLRRYEGMIRIFADKGDPYEQISKVRRENRL